MVLLGPNPQFFNSVITLGEFNVCTQILLSFISQVSCFHVTQRFSKITKVQASLMRWEESTLARGTLDSRLPPFTQFLTPKISYCTAYLSDFWAVAVVINFNYFQVKEGIMSS